MEASSQPLAGVDVTDRQREQRETEDEQDQVEHGVFPSSRSRDFIAQHYACEHWCSSGGTGRHRFSRGERVLPCRNLIVIGSCPLARPCPERTGIAPTYAALITWRSDPSRILMHA